MQNLYSERLKMIPAGKRVVPEPERQKVLVDLIEAKNELVKNLERFPIFSIHAIRSDKTEKEKYAMENKLIKVDNAIKLYSNPPVFVNYQ